MPKGCLFPDFIPNRDICQRYLTQLTREGSNKLGGFHCLLPKDRITWDNQYIVHIYYIHVRTVVKEVNKGVRCVHLSGVVTVISIFQSARLIPYLVSPCTRTKKRSTTTTTNITETPHMWPGAQGLFNHHNSSCLRIINLPPLGTSQTCHRHTLDGLVRASSRCHVPAGCDNF